MSKLKHSLIEFSFEEIRIATLDFDEGSRNSLGLYHGEIIGPYLTIGRWIMKKLLRTSFTY